MTTTAPAGSLDPHVGPDEEAWLICGACRALVYRKRFARLHEVCPECGRHSRIEAGRRLGQLLDAGSAVEIEVPDTVHDPLGFADRLAYPRRLEQARRVTGHRDAVRAARGSIEGRPAVVVVMDFAFMGGSLGVAAGEAIATAADTALEHGLPLVLVTASGGARMQEGALSLMQMAKTSNAMAALDEAGLLTVTVVTDPTYGGVAASFAGLADVILAEPGARMGFAGPRVIAQTIGETLPAGFQTAEFLLENGLIDDVRPRAGLRAGLARLLDVAARPAEWGGAEASPVIDDPGRLRRRPATEIVALARNLDRPTTLDHIGNWFDGFFELHGDRVGDDCPAMVGGVAQLDGLPVMVLGHQKGHSTTDLVRRNFGMPGPAGYRKARRLLDTAAKLGLPVVTLIDTPGAYPGVSAERDGQSLAIAECIRTMGALPVPVVAVVTGEGGSGGALALGVADRLLMCANATFSVISPEGCAAILWKSATESGAAAAALGLDPQSLLELGVVDGVIPEPPGGAHQDPVAAGDLIRRAVVGELRDLLDEPGAKLVARRRERIRGLGLVPAAGARRWSA
ncbi:acetyl-CoA carboxylase carboxyl transferase subunit alpha [uncultured Pseudonocardia sp.]|uniref:acetyl-CoA carboxylase carboxyl transferase subunit alpha n=1 Tax=uncultured Pseudonocardia sp. TaxID=211455 RepID=UPI002631A576|nr:acetyl-CoA carboxylase carboxyl transferase subunit alpha [uncultured Pseudonocardia sp.]